MSFEGSGNAPSTRARGGRFGRLVAIVLSVVAIGLSLIAISLYFLASPGETITLLPGTTQSQGASDGIAAATPPAEQRDFAERMYVEQIESHRVLERMASGQLRSLVLRDVRADSTLATLSVIATFDDGTYGDGVMSLRKLGNSWYLFALTGLRLRTASGYSVAIEPATTAEASHTVAEGLAAEGMSTIDEAVINTFMAQATTNQLLITRMLDGTYNAFTFGSPSTSSGAITLPMTVTGPHDAHAAGRVTLVRKEIDGSQRTFLMTLSAD